MRRKFSAAEIKSSGIMFEFSIKKILKDSVINTKI